MLKKFLNGLLFGSGFAIAFIIILVIYFKFFFESTINSSFSNNDTAISEVPVIQKAREKFLGSPAIYVGGFLDNKDGVLSSGSGEIKAVVKSNGQPTEGLKLRLALNGKVMSQWAISDKMGEYRVSVPYGEYKIDGFELDSQSANKVLAGLIDSPFNPHSTEKFIVSEDELGVGIDFNFVSPVIKTTKNKSFTLNEPVIISWAPYVGASSYQIQIFEKENPHEYIGNNRLFAWAKRPEVEKTSINIQSYTNKLKVGNYYSYEVIALDENNHQISESPKTYQGYDFRINRVRLD